MALLNRLAGIDLPDGAGKLSVGAFWACLYEMAQGKVARQKIIDYFALDSSEVTELDWLIARYNAQPNATAKANFVSLLEVVFYLAESTVPGYTTNAEIVARLNAI